MFNVRSDDGRRERVDLTRFLDVPFEALEDVPGILKMILEQVGEAIGAVGQRAFPAFPPPARALASFDEFAELRDDGAVVGWCRTDGWRLELRPLRFRLPDVPQRASDGS
jgi:hypothetical protein